MKRLSLLALMLCSAGSWAGAYVDHGEWERHEIRVCFAPAEKEKRLVDDQYRLKVNTWDKQRKRQVQEWVQAEYTPTRTGVHFTGFRDCNSVEPVDAPLFLGRGSAIAMWLRGGAKGLAIMGSWYAPGEIPGFPTATSFAWLNSAGFGKGTTVHEFGHLARLAHENERLEANDDPRCASEPQALIGVRRSQGFTYFRDYDPESIMNYCWLHAKGGEKKGLSAGDVALLRFLYP